MQLHDLKPTTRNKTKKRVGRGGKRGAYSGKGLKGQKSRAGHRLRPELRDIIKKLPKMRGYKIPKIGIKPDIVNLDDLEKYFSNADVVSVKTLRVKGVLRLRQGLGGVKVLGRGELTKKLFIENCQVSKSALVKIKKAGGQIKPEGLSTKSETSTNVQNTKSKTK